MFNKVYRVENRQYSKRKQAFTVQRQDKAFLVWKRGRLSKQGGRCFYCLTFIPLKGSNTEHLIPLYRGGTSQRSNLVVSCWSCNKDKGIKLYSKSEILKLRQRINQVVKEDLARIKAEQEDVDSKFHNL